METEDGVPIEGVRVEVLDTAIAEQTDRRGEFRLDASAEGGEAKFRHPRFAEVTAPVPTPTDASWRIVLSPKQAVFEEIVITANRDASNAIEISSSATTRIAPADEPAPSATLTELIEGTPGVSENGQGGIFQTYSIRGISRQRVLTLIDGVPIVGERRAGVSASFLDPALMASVEVVRGPASSSYGSGALGGIVQVFPRSDEALALEAGYGTAGDAHYLVLGYGTAGPDGWSVGLAQRRSNDHETPDGEQIFDRFESWSASLAKRWQTERRQWQLRLIPTLGRDIGKASSDFPQRTTIYPEERHLLARLTARDQAGWSWSLYAHPNDLRTDSVDDGELSVVENQALDYGASLVKEASGERGTWRWGVDWTGRQGVTAEEAGQRTLDDADQEELSLFGSARTGVGPWVFEAGGRATAFRQGNGGAESRRDEALNGFVGLSLPLPSGFEITANVGTGLRFPSLTERFFTGTTGRGRVIGNPDLEPERSTSAEAGLRWYGSRTFAAVHLFRNQIDDLVERIRIDDDTRTFRNLTAGRVEGLEIEGFFQPAEAWLISWGGHRFDSSSDDGGPLADVPPDRLRLEGRWQRGRWHSSLRWEHREAVDEPGPGERAIPSAELLTAAVGVRLRDSLQVTLSGTNLLDRTYFRSADDRAPLAEGRGVSLALRWSPSSASTP